jgi:hypothetical protein
MNTSITELTAMAASQAAQIPSTYGRVDFSVTPERFAVAPADETELAPEYAQRRPELLASKERVALIKAYTMHGDPVADAYAALIPQHGFQQLVAMLKAACEHGLESVTSAPPELVSFIQDMERFPAWLDAKLIEQGARIERNAYAHRAPFIIRGGLIATFMNKYAALPMALTGGMSSKSAAHRVNETAIFFTQTVMPDVLDRHGAAFQAAAMVRLMHAMVRFNILSRGDRWDVKTYGIRFRKSTRCRPVLCRLTSLHERRFAKAARRSRPPSARAPNWPVTAASYSACPKICSRSQRPLPPPIS